MDAYHFIYDTNQKQYISLFTKEGGAILKNYIRLYKQRKQQSGGFVDLSIMKNAQWKELSQGDQCILKQGKIHTPQQQTLNEYMDDYNNLTPEGEPDYDTSSD